jgi:hypothetical protein
VGGPLGRPSVRPGLSSPFSLRLRRGPALGIIPHSSRQRPGNVKKRWGRPSKESAGQALNSDIVAGGGIGPANSLKVETRVRTPLGLHRKAQVEALSSLNDDSPLPFVLHLSRGRRRHVTSDPPNHGPPRRRGRSPPSPLHEHERLSHVRVRREQDDVRRHGLLHHPRCGDCPTARL